MRPVVVGHPADARWGFRASAVPFGRRDSGDRTWKQSSSPPPARPIGRANKGSLVDLRPDDLGATIVQALLEKVPERRPRPDRGRDLGQRAAGRRGGLQRRPGDRAARGARRRAGRHREPLLLVVAADHPHGRARDQGRRGRRVRRRWRRDGEPLPLRHVRRRAGHAQREVRRRRGAHGEAHRGRVRLVGADLGSARHLHRDGSDGRERRRVRQGDARGDGRVRRALAAARGRVAGERVLRA